MIEGIVMMTSISVQPPLIFSTKMHNEKVAKKSGAAEKKEYKSSGNKTRKSK